MIITQASDIKVALQRRIRLIDLEVPQGKATSEFVADMVVEAAKLPDMKVYSPYEIEGIIREMADLS